MRFSSVLELHIFNVQLYAFLGIFQEKIVLQFAILYG
jgi:hypothetical protein